MRMDNSSVYTHTKQYTHVVNLIKYVLQNYENHLTNWLHNKVDSFREKWRLE